MLPASLIAIGLLITRASPGWGQSLEKAREVYLKGDWEGQAHELQGYLVGHPDDVEALFDFAHALLRLRRYPESIKMLSMIIERDPTNTNALDKRANAYYANGQFPEALLDCDKLLRSDPDGSLLWIVRAKINVKLGRTRDAIDDVTRELNSRYRFNEFENRAYRASLYRAVGEYDLAIADCSWVLSMLPTHQAALEERANNYELIGEHELAQDDREELADTKARTFVVGVPVNLIVDADTGQVIAAGTGREPTSKQAEKRRLPDFRSEIPETVPDGLSQRKYYKLARRYGWEHWEQTLVCIDRINNLDTTTEFAAKANRMKDTVLPKHMPPPQEAVALSSEAFNCISDRDRCRRLAETCIERYPNFEYGYIVRGAFEKDVGRPAAARAYFEKALEINPHNVMALSRLGDILRDIDKEQAKVTLRCAVKLDPDDSFDRYILHNMERE